MAAEPFTASTLFHHVFAPLYPPGANLADLRGQDANPGKNPAIFAEIHHAALVFAHRAPQAFGLPDLLLDFSDASVHRLGAALTRDRRNTWLNSLIGSSPALVTIVTHGALYLGSCIVNNHGGVWQVRNPLWESLVRLESKVGTADLALFQWWLKALSDDEIDKGRLVDRYRTYVENPTFQADLLPIVAPTDRPLPRLAKVTYPTLFKHLKAHLPELKTFGDDFPSPERLQEIQFHALDFLLLGQGRMLLMHGACAQGVHLFWLDINGFVKSAYYPADAFPAHRVQIEGEKLRVILSIQGQMQVHEMMWWGS